MQTPKKGKRVEEIDCHKSFNGKRILLKFIKNVQEPTLNIYYLFCIQFS